MKSPPSLALFFTIAFSAVQADPATAATGGIDLETANRIVTQYARHVLSELPRDWREAEEAKWKSDPPRIDAQGIYQLKGPKGNIAFEYDADGKRLLCWSLIHKPREAYPRIGLTRDEILEALRQAGAKGVDTGGGTVTLDPDSNGFFLLRVYDEPPKSAKQLTKELDRLTAAGEKWFRKHYLEAVLRHAESMRPPASATARDGDFAVTLVLSPDKRYHELWHRPPGAVQPQLVTRSKYVRGEEVWAMSLFKGATPGEDGSVRIEAQYSFVYPDGQEAGSKPFVLWEGAPPPVDHLQMVEDRAAIELGDDMLLGDYVARIKVCDPRTQRCVTAETPFRLVPDSEP